MPVKIQVTSGIYDRPINPCVDKFFINEKDLIALKGAFFLHLRTFQPKWQIVT
jgi:hypothetical protein